MHLGIPDDAHRATAADSVDVVDRTGRTTRPDATGRSRALLVALVIGAALLGWGRRGRRRKGRHLTA